MTVNLEPVDGLSMDVADQVVVITRKFLSINTAGIAPIIKQGNPVMKAPINGETKPQVIPINIPEFSFLIEYPTRDQYIIDAGIMNWAHSNEIITSPFLLKIA